MSEAEPLLLVGGYGSPYSRKMRAVLRYRRIPFRWILRGSRWDVGIPDVPVALIPHEARPVHEHLDVVVGFDGSVHARGALWWTLTHVRRSARVLAVRAYESVIGEPLSLSPEDAEERAREDLESGVTAVLGDLDGRDVLLLDEGHCLRQQTLALCEASGAGEMSGFRASSLATIAQMVAGGVGVTLLPELAVEREAAAAPSLVTIPFGVDGPARTIGLAWRGRSPRADEYHALGDTLTTAYARS